MGHRWLACAVWSRLWFDFAFGTIAAWHCSIALHHYIAALHCSTALQHCIASAFEPKVTHLSAPCTHSSCALCPQPRAHICHSCHWSPAKSIKNHFMFDVNHFYSSSPAKITFASPSCILLETWDKSWSSKFTAEYQPSAFIPISIVFVQTSLP